MWRKADWFSGGSLLAFVLLGPGAALAAPPASSQPGAAGQANIVLPALPSAPVVIRSDAGRAPPSSTAPKQAGPAPSAKAAAPPAAPQPAQHAQEQAAPPQSPPPPLQTALAAFLGTDQAKTRNALETRRRRQAIAAFYASRAYAPLWLAHGEWTPAARAVVARLEQADDDGLEAADLAIPGLGSGDEASREATELALTDSVVRYGEEASGGRVSPRAVSSLIADPHTRLEPAEILSRIAAASDPAQTLDELDPPQPGYRALRAQLVEMRAAHKDASALRAPPGRTLRTGMAPTGVLTPRTLAALSGGKAASVEAAVIANMELWRWAPRDMGLDRIEVNIPDYSLTLYHGEDAVRRARVVVGKATTPTPIFSNTVRYVVVNPSWTVPQSIVKKEMLPKLAADPNYFQEMGYIVTHKGDLVEVRQPPGDRNALGRIKFLFPNDYDVYLHDTPERALFNASKRAFSHGCVRVQDPFALGQDVLGAANGWSEARLKKMIGDKERTIRVAKPLPIHIEYFTAFVDAAGRLQLRPDIYGYARKVERALGLVG